MNPELILALSGLTVLLGLIGWPAWSRHRRLRTGQRPFPAAWRKLLQRQFPLYNHLPPPLQKQLQAMVQVFVADKPLIGCQGLTVTDDMRVLVAAQACLPVLMLHGAGDHPHPYPELRQVLLYPSSFVVSAKHHEPGGVVSEGREERLGESWQEGIVVLSWPDALAGAQSGQWPRPGQHHSTEDQPAAHNVVLHEFAHQLDQEIGPANGAPLLRPGQSAQTWAQVFQRAYEDLRWLVDAGEETLIDPYGASAPEEFFAVAVETFFMQPRAMSERHPDLYAQLKQYFRLDPTLW
ncbi:MAG TPA: zinc-dependent peptidase [Burkholderiaceae bacterium]|nr:zinc-dependent peptidase [Burkholderiaceae bacterium]